MDRRTAWVAALALLVMIALAGLYLPYLNRAGMLSVDEPRYAAIGREMATSGDWITPRLWESAWFEKPPLLYWLIALATRAGLHDEWAARAPIALLSLLFLAFFLWRLWRWFDPVTAIMATGILGSAAWWFAFSQAAVTDLPLAATFGAAMLLAMEQGRAERIVAGVLFGLAILAKAAVPIVLALPILFWAGRKWPRLTLPFAVALAVAAPWYWLCYRANGWPFIEELFIRHHWARFTTGDTLHARPWWFYLPVLVAGLFPWSLLLPTLIRREVWTNERLRFFTLWAGWGLLFFSKSAGKLPGYLLPLFPALAVLLAVGLRSRSRWRAMVALAPGLVILVIPVVLEVVPNAVDRGLGRTALGWRSSFGWWLAAAAGASAVTFGIAKRQGMERAFAVTLTATLVGFGVAKPRLLTALDRAASARAEAQAVEKLRTELDDPPVCFGEIRRTWEYGINYYAEEPIARCEETPEAGTVRIENAPDGGLVLRQGDREWPVATADGDVTSPVAPKNGTSGRR